jgi:hypothetical protein
MAAATTDLTAQSVRGWAAAQLEPQALASKIDQCAPLQRGGERVIECLLRLTAAGLFNAGWISERGLAHALWTHGAYADGVTEAEVEQGLSVTGRTARGEGRNWYARLGFQRDSCALDGRSDDDVPRDITQAGGAPRYGADAEHERRFQVEPSCLSWCRPLVQWHL